jgi:hypothetical protein
MTDLRNLQDLKHQIHIVSSYLYNSGQLTYARAELGIAISMLNQMIIDATKLSWYWRLWYWIKG